MKSTERYFLPRKHELFYDISLSKYRITTSCNFKALILIY